MTKNDWRTLQVESCAFWRLLQACSLLLASTWSSSMTTYHVKQSLKPIATLIRPFSSTLVPTHQSWCIRIFFRGLEKRLAGSSPGIHALLIPLLWIPGFRQARALAPAIPSFCSCFFVCHCLSHRGSLRRPLPGSCCRAKRMADNGDGRAGTNDGLHGRARCKEKLLL